MSLNSPSSLILLVLCEVNFHTVTFSAFHLSLVARGPWSVDLFRCQQNKEKGKFNEISNLPLAFYLELSPSVCVSLQVCVCVCSVCLHLFNLSVYVCVCVWVGGGLRAWCPLCSTDSCSFHAR